MAQRVRGNQNSRIKATVVAVNTTSIKLRVEAQLSSQDTEVPSYTIPAKYHKVNTPLWLVYKERSISVEPFIT